MCASSNRTNPYGVVLAFGICLALVGIAMLIFRLGGVGPTEINVFGLDVHTVSAGVVLIVLGIATMLLSAGQMIKRGTSGVTPNLKPAVLGQPVIQNDHLHKAVEARVRLNDEHVVRFDAASDRPGALSVTLNVDGHQWIRGKVSPDQPQIDDSFPLDGGQWVLNCSLGTDGQVSPSLTINGYPIFGVAPVRAAAAPPRSAR